MLDRNSWSEKTLLLQTFAKLFDCQQLPVCLHVGCGQASIGVWVNKAMYYSTDLHCDALKPSIDNELIINFIVPK